MSMLSAAAASVLISWQSLVAASPTATPPLRPDTAPIAVVGDSGRMAPPDAGPTVRPVALMRLVRPDSTPQDTVARRRAKAVEYSDGYYKRLALHKALSWAMLPLFAASYVSGDQLLSKNDAAPQWAKSVHPIAATGAAVLFGANAFTGGWNLWEGRKDPSGRTRRIIHSVLFTAASGGFAYAGTRLADEAEESAAKRRDHRNLALASMGVSTASWLIMLIGN